MDYKEQERAELLNEVHVILFSSRHQLGWINFYTPDIENLKNIRGRLELAVTNLTNVIDDKLFPTTQN